MSDVRTRQRSAWDSWFDNCDRRPWPPSTHPFRSDDPRGEPEGRMSELPSGLSRGPADAGLGPGFGPGALGACSSAGQSARLISVRSAVQIGPGPPIQMSDDRCQMTEGTGVRHETSAPAGQALRSGLRDHRDDVLKWRMAEDVAGRSRPDRPPSDICHLSLISEIVKRVVTVKQVRPSPPSSLRWGEVGPGAWVCVRPMRRASAGAAVCARSRRGCGQEADDGWSLTTVV
jgi:hypothetical protein